jgi:hypothetical protein
MTRTFKLVALLGLAWSLAGAACNEDPANPTFNPPLRVIFAYPGPMADLEDNTPFDISLDFNRPVGRLSDMNFLFAPPPDSTDGDPVLSPSRLNITWFGVATRQGSTLQRFLIDGSEMLAPEILVWITGDNPEAEFSGVLDTGSADRRVDRSVVFGLSVFGDFDPQDPVTFESEIPIAFGKPDSLDVAQSKGDYRIRRLERGIELYVVAIHDTSGDGRYSPLDDWWGYYRDPLTGSAGIVTAYELCLSPGAPCPPADIDITLGPPFDPLE